MTTHMHAEFVEGCYRCDLNKDEVGSPLDYLRDVFAHGENVVGGKVDLTGLGESSAEFDRILNDILADAWDEGYRKGVDDQADGWNSDVTRGPDHDPIPQGSPYREA